jgi:predicted O-methyltransferase YrrM
MREARYYLDELDDDQILHGHIKMTTATSPYARIADPEPRYGRRAGWYAIARLMKPTVVVETGVDKGLGACVLTAALLLNTEEGHPGHYFGTDINQRAGYLLTGRYAEAGKIIYGDSLGSLANLSEPIDLFINDSDHSTEYERLEYEEVRDRLGSGAIVLGDNSDFSPELLNIAQETGRRFLLFNEQPKNHWYRGGSIGACFK